MTKNRVIAYIILFVVLVVGIQLKIQVIKKKAAKKVVSIDSEWKEYGKPINVYKIAKKDMSSFKKISGTLAKKDLIHASASYGLRSELWRGQHAQVQLQSGKKIKGVISKISTEVELDSGLYHVEIFLNQKHDGRVGSIVVSEVKVSNLSKVLKIPADSIVEEGDKRFCWVVKDSKAMKKEIVLGKKNGLYFEVLKGLYADDLVVTDGKKSLKDNAQVRIYKTTGEI